MTLRKIWIVYSSVKNLEISFSIRISVSGRRTHWKISHCLLKIFFLVRVITLPRLTYGNLKIPGIEPSHTCKCETSDRNVFGGRIELDGRGDRRCGDPRDREYCDRDGGLEPKTIF